MATALTLTLSDEVLARMQAAAAQAGLSPEAWAARALADALGPPGVREDATPSDTARGDNMGQPTPETRAHRHAASLAALGEYDRTGISHPLEDVLTEARADLEARLAAKA